MKCKHVQQQLLDYSEDLLDKKSRVLIEGHLQQCSECTQELRDIKRTVHLLQSIPFQEPSETFWHGFTANVMRKIERMETTPVTRPFLFFPQFKVAFAVAVLIIIIGLGFLFYATSVRQTLPPPELTTQRSEQQAKEFPISSTPAEEKTVDTIFEGIASEELLHNILDTEFALIDGSMVGMYDVDNSDEMLYFLISTLTEEEKDLLLSELYKMK